MKLQFERVKPRVNESFHAIHNIGPNFECPYHFHPELELTYIQHGHGTRVIGGQLAHFEAGDLLLIGANVPHWYYNDPTHSTQKDWARSIVVQFLPNALGDSFLGIPETRQISELFERAQNGLQITGSTHHQVVERIAKLPQQSGYTRLLNFLSIFGELIKEPDEVLLIPDEGKLAHLENHDAERIERVFRYLNTHYREPVSLETVAQIASMTPPAFSRFFRQKTGTTFQQTLIETRLLDACQALITSNCSISEICFACGFNNLSNFNRQFKRNKGLSPKSFRKCLRSSMMLRIR